MRKELSNDILKDFIKYVSFNVISMIGLSCYILADTFFVANGVGSIGLTALNLVLPVYSLVSGIGLMIGMGAATKYSIYRGRNNEKKANKIFTHAIILGVLVGLILTVVGILFSYDIASILGADELVNPLAGMYLKTILMFSCAFIINNIVICFVRNDDNPNLSMIAMLLGSFSNIILDYIFIFPFKLGMFGAAFATGLAPLISLIVLSMHFIKRANNFKFVKCKINMGYIKNIVSLGIPSFITEFSSGVIMLVFNFTILNIANNIGVAAYGIIANLALIVVAIFTGIAQGMQPIISKNYGEGKTKNIKIIYKYALITATGIGLLCYLSGIVFSEEIINIFNKERNQELLSIANEGIKIYFTAFFIMGLNIVTTSFFASINEAKESFIISIMRGLIIVTPLILLLPRLFGIIGVWITIPLAEVSTLLIGIVLYLKYARGFKEEK
ncbi:MATE family efflux transporter [Clostridium sp. DSM 100503]|uniref:MATE family efflux transporter n=1 Tax=Clostridium sp. DSM 100503 TaxID=2963282 RepID=UPI002149F35E|nr:MATE family efflux transporter [Clostridium sp. DSM 100503]MCR1950944.1 MATE family efflux transporter [Clostridium sp. DSM 100503]